MRLHSHVVQWLWVLPLSAMAWMLLPTLRHVIIAGLVGSALGSVIKGIVYRRQTPTPAVTTTRNVHTDLLHRTTRETL